MTKIIWFSTFVAVLSIANVVESGILFPKLEDVYHTKDIIWFPSSDGDGKLIQAKLKPDQKRNGSLILGDISDVHFYLFTRCKFLCLRFTTVLANCL